MKSRTALIFGVFGQDGSYMAELLWGKGYRVIGTSRDPESARGRFAGPCWDALDVLQTDMRSTEAIATLIDRAEPDEIYNFAAFSTGSGMYDRPVDVGDVNGLAVARILDAIRDNRAPIRFCQASSSEIFGATSVSPQNEATAFAPRSPYGAAKLFAHNLVDIARRRDAIFACSSILFNHESPRRTPDFVSRKITRAAAAIRVGRAKDLVLGDLEARRDWGHARDAVQAMWLMLQADQAEDYVIATGRTHSVSELCNIAFSHVGLDWTQYVRVDARFQRAPDNSLLVGDPARARARLGWTPSVSFEEMIKEMVDHDLLEIRSDLVSNEHAA